MPTQVSPVAARYMAEDFDLFGGCHSVTAAFSKYLAYLHRPFTEAMLLGLGGGVGFSYREETGSGAAALSGRFEGTRPFDFENGMLARIGAEPEWQEFDDPDDGHAALLGSLEIGEPALLYVDMGELPYFAHPRGVHFGGHTLLVYAIEGDDAWISDCCHGPVCVPVERLTAARFSNCGPRPPRGRILRLNPPFNPVSATASIRSAIELCCRSLEDPVAADGLNGLRQWSRAVAAWRDLDRAQLFRRLRMVHDRIEIMGTGGGAFRRLYADFLDEAAGVLGIDGLRRASGRYRECAARWTQVAHAALPAHDATLFHVRVLVEERARLFATQSDHARMRDIAGEIDILNRAWAEGAGVDAITHTLSGLKTAAELCAVAEEAALGALRACWAENGRPSRPAN